jgi:hypothetical protein
MALRLFSVGRGGASERLLAAIAVAVGSSGRPPLNRRITVASSEVRVAPPRLGSASFCVTRSSTIASSTMAMPPTAARPTSRRPRPWRTTSPNPSAPIIATTTESTIAVSTVWLRPPRMVGMARGSWISNRSWRLSAPKARPASTISCSTMRMPRLVKRIRGGAAAVTTATSPGTVPTPNSMTTGTR